MKILVAGSGGWGTALAIRLLQNGHTVTLWSYCAQESEQLAATCQNPFLPGVALPKELCFTSEPFAAQGMDMVVFATPSFAVRSTAKAFAPYLREDAVIVSVTKGIEEETGLRMSELVEQETGKIVVALSGPSHAEEVSRGIPTGVVAACADKELAEAVQTAFMCERLRVYTSPDTVGVELGAAHKNVIALCAGICDGLGYGDNTKALLMTRGLAELARLGMALGASRETFAGLAGVGDLIVTCTSMHSRNRRAGILIGQGVGVQEAMKQVGAVVEGYYAARAAWKLAEKHGVEMPITKAAYEVLYENRDPREAIHTLMERQKTAEAAYSDWAR
ncbi:MAG: glycerol-3-phosphate dehydrogenase [Clostridiales bacterium]|nr:glycerol-3-phosphate dehydrogenase [Clostridiales bacterium]